MSAETQKVDPYAPITGEGDIKVVIKRRVRRDCDNCGEPAMKEINYCYVNGRRNPASSMYGRDDCTYCSDAKAYACEACERQVQRVCCPDGMGWSSTFTCNDRNAHRFLYWSERDATAEEAYRVGGAA